jgi:hypothetical protein
VRVERLHLFNQFVIALSNRVGFFINDHLVGKEHIISRNRVAVMPLDPFTQMKD